jgi:hypothetical protein
MSLILRPIRPNVLISPRSTFEGAKSALELGLWQLGKFVDRLPLADEPESLQSRPGKVHKTPPADGASAGGPNVFIIHWRAAGGFRDSVSRFIEQLGLTPVILAEQASAGRH